MNNIIHFAVIEITTDEMTHTDLAIKRFFKTENIDVIETWALEWEGSDGYMLESLYYKIERSYFTIRTSNLRLLTMKAKKETRGLKPTDFPTKQVRVPIAFEKQVKAYIEFLKYESVNNDKFND